MSVTFNNNTIAVLENGRLTICIEKFFTTDKVIFIDDNVTAMSLSNFHISYIKGPTNTLYNYIFSKNEYVNIADNVSAFDCSIHYTSFITSNTLYLYHCRSTNKFIIKIADNVIHVKYMFQDIILYTIKSIYQTDSKETYDLYMSENGTIEKIVSDIVAFDCGQTHAVYITSNNELYTYGANGVGQRGCVKSEYAVPKKIFDNVSAVSCGENHTAFIADNNLYVFGSNCLKQLGVNHKRKIIGVLKVEEKVSVVHCIYNITIYQTKRQQYVFGHDAHKYFNKKVYIIDPIEYNKNILIKEWSPNCHYLVLADEHKLFMTIIMILRRYRRYLPKLLMIQILGIIKII